MRLLLTLVILTNVLFCYSQEGANDTLPQTGEMGLYVQDKSACGTADVSYKDWIGEIRKYGLSQNKNNLMTHLPLRAHIVTHDDGSGGLSLEDLNIALANLNNMYHPAEIEWFITEVNYIAESQYYDYDISEENDLCLAHEVDDAVNVFFVNSINGGIYCGYAYLPSNSDVSLRILMDNECTATYLNGTFVHEFGHHFNLQHTHRGTSNGNTDPNAENVPRTGAQANCDTHGDFICDTEADPTGPVDVNCEYAGGASDIYGNQYDPLEDNVMSYYSDNCGGSFTTGQQSIITQGLNIRMAHSAYNIDGAAPQNVTDPDSLSIVNNSLSLVLNWNDNANNETGYIIERSDDGGNTFIALPFGGVSSNVTSFTDHNIIPSQEYHYRIKASNDNPDDYSNIAVITTDNCQYTNLNFDNSGVLDDTPVTLVNLPIQMPSCQDSAMVTIQVVGDFGANFEICDILAEDNSTVISQTVQSALDCDSGGGVSSFYMNSSDYNTWASDGSMTFYVGANPLVNEFCPDNTFTACINLETCSDDSECPPDYDGPNMLTGVLDTSANFETNGAIMSDQMIQLGVDVIYDSGTAIEILPGFEILIGSVLDATIDGCNN